MERSSKEKELSEFMSGVRNDKRTKKNEVNN
jgi:hypothetical protein